mmetsp:Transcript_115589/g.222761  ORF Transcript_115589/g.222761 Transcript_115589/m.222761 type:complete len:350 (+) Transcript_115589:93-1142(+)
MADWDPFAEPSDSAADAPKTAAEEPAVATQESAPVFAPAKRVAERPVPEEVGLWWHVPGCTSANWKHTDVKFEVDEGIAYLTLNRPAQKNAITSSVHMALRDAVSELYARQGDIRVVVLQAEGAYFSSGGDTSEPAAAQLGCLKEPAALEAVEQLKERAKTATGFEFKDDVAVPPLLNLKFFQAFQMLPQFTIAVAMGSAIGMGAALLCLCDMVIMKKQASLLFPEGKMGVIASITPCVVSKIGHQKAKRIMCTGDQLKAEIAKEVGIADEVVSNLDEAKELVRGLCGKISACSPGAIAGHKSLILGSLSGAQITDQMIYATAAAHVGSLASPEGKPDAPWRSKPIKPR